MHSNNEYILLKFIKLQKLYNRNFDKSVYLQHQYSLNVFYKIKNNIINNIKKYLKHMKYFQCTSKNTCTKRKKKVFLYLVLLKNIATNVLKYLKHYIYCFNPFIFI